MKYTIEWDEYLPSACRELDGKGFESLCSGQTVVMAPSEAEAYEAMRKAFPRIYMKGERE